jgi:nucleotide-binding universal stress UspA family protein
MRTIHRIVCPVDFSPISKHSLDFAVDLARRYGADVQVLHVYPASVRAEDAHTEHYHRQLDALIADYAGTGVTLHGVLARGVAHEQILEASKGLNADLIVLGKSGSSALAHVFLGSVAERVVRHSRVPVLTVRPRN